MIIGTWLSLFILITYKGGLIFYTKDKDTFELTKNFN